MIRLTITAVASLCRSMLALQAASLSSAALAQSPARPATEQPPAVVTGSRLPSTPTGLAKSVTVIDPLQLQQGNPARLEDILNRVMGIYVDQAGKTGSFASLYVRGAENSQLLIMVDGVKLNDPTTTRGSAYDLSSIDVGQIERIEILRGPESAIHGGEALAGVLNIITKKGVGGGVHGNAYAGRGEDDDQRLGGSLTFGAERVRAQVGVGRSEDGSHSSDAWLRQNTFSSSVRVAPGSGHRRRSVRAPRAAQERGVPRRQRRSATRREPRQYQGRDATHTAYGVRGGTFLSPTLRLHVGASTSAARAPTTPQSTRVCAIRSGPTSATPISAARRCTLPARSS